MSQSKTRMCATMAKTVQMTCVLYRLPNSRLSGGRTVTPMAIFLASVRTDHQPSPEKYKLKCQ